MHDPHADSGYLRAAGLVPHVLDLLGDCRDLDVLDTGSGSGWIFESVAPRLAVACDITAPPRRLAGVRNTVQDVRRLGFAAGSFDVVLSSLVLMWVDDLAAAFAEAHRVTRGGGRMIVALTHPYFYHTGTAVNGDDYLIDRSLRTPATRPGFFISGVVGPLTYHYRPIVDYYTAALAAGWELTAFRDWFIDPADYRAHAAGLRRMGARSTHVPTFTFFVCRK